MGKTRNGESGASAAGRSADALAAGVPRRRGPAPVHLWNPPHCGAIDMRIARDGTWFHEGTPIGRMGLVRLFASILRRDPEGFVLVTPHEKVGIEVEDAPFVAVDVEREGEDLRFVTNLGDEAVAGPERPIRVERGLDGEPRPYVLVRGGLEALIDRKTFYRLVEMGEVAPHEGAEWFGVRSGGAFFPIGPAADLAGDT
jgi:hypothetical protein